MEFYYKHYISVDEKGRIVDGFSDAFRNPSNTDICIDEQGGYQFRLYPGGVENPFLLERTYMIPLYKYENGTVVKRTEEEIEADIAELPKPTPPPAPDPDEISDAEALRIITGEVNIDETK